MKTLALSLYRAAALSVLLGTAWTASAESIHRYSFATNANDSVGTAHGAAVTTPNGTTPTFAAGQVTLDGAGGYIDLPNRLVSILTNITVEAWVTVDNNANWARILDFGTSTTGELTPEGTVGTGLDYMFVTANGAGSLQARFAITDNSNGDERPILIDPTDFPVGVEAHIAVVYGPPVARLYVDGILVASSGAAVIPLSALNDNNVWLGRSQWADPFFSGSFNEVRISNNLIGGPELKASKLAGPDTVDYNPGTISAVTLVASNIMIQGGLQVPTVTANFSKIGLTTLAASEVTLTSSATNIIEVQANGSLLAKAVGTATVTATRDGVNGTFNITVQPPLNATLRHRYGFGGSGPAITDSVGGASFNGTVIPPFATTAVPNPGAVTLANGRAQFPSGVTWDSAGYIDLPDGLVSSKTNITIETWITWNGPNDNAGQNWSRIFDFGTSTKGDNAQFSGNGTALSYMFLTPRANGDSTRFAAQPTGGTETGFNRSPTMPVGTPLHIVAIYAPDLNASKLYVNNELYGTATTPFRLNELVDGNNWLGASQWQDTPFFGSYDEFRIYEGVLNDVQIAVSRHAGPDTLASDPGTLQTVSLAPPTLRFGDGTAALAGLKANFQNVTNVEITSLPGTTYSSGNTNIFTVSATGGLLPRTLGTATLTAGFSGKSATANVTVAAPTALRATVAAPATGGPLRAGGLSGTLTVNGDFPGSTNVNVTAYAGITHVSSNTNVVTVGAAGVINPVGRGTATITSTLAGVSATLSVTVESALPNFLQDSTGLVVMEAESFHSKTIAPDGHFWDYATARADRSGTGYMVANPNSGVNRNQAAAADVISTSTAINFKVNFNRTGVHYVWVRGGGAAAGGADDSTHAGLNGAITAQNFQGTPGFNVTAWNWVNLLSDNVTQATFNVPSVGEHTVTVWMREDGFFFDKIIVTSDAAFIPDAVNPLGPAESARAAAPPEGARFTSATIAGGNLSIQWTGGGTLESATSISGPWATVAGAASPYTTPANDAARFYRVRGQ